MPDTLPSSVFPPLWEHKITNTDQAPTMCLCSTVSFNPPNNTVAQLLLLQMEGQDAGLGSGVDQIGIHARLIPKPTLQMARLGCPPATSPEPESSPYLVPGTVSGTVWKSDKKNIRCL